MQSLETNPFLLVAGVQIRTFVEGMKSNHQTIFREVISLLPLLSRKW
jgi:hypothetical protein